jgi:hypothetical protein
MQLEPKAGMWQAHVLASGREVPPPLFKPSAMQILVGCAIGAPVPPKLDDLPSGIHGVAHHVAAGTDERVLVHTMLARAMQGANHTVPEAIGLTPHLMILPLPPNQAVAEFPETADPIHPLTLWMRACGTPINYATVLVPEPVHQALRVLPPNPTRLLQRD